MPKRIEKLTKIQEAAIPWYRDKWIAQGLKTGETDWETFDKFMPICYAKANLAYPKNIVRVQSPLVGGLAAAIAEAIWFKKDGAVGDAVRGAVGGAVDDAVRIISRLGLSINWHYWLGGQFWVGGWYWGVSFANFFFDVCKLKLSKDIMERAKAYRKVCESVNYIWPNSNFIMVCARPTAIKRNDRGRLHSEVGKAIEYPDGWGLYCLDGITFAEEEYWSIINKTISAKAALAIANTDKRAIAIKYLGGDRIVTELGGKTIDKNESKQIGELLELKIKDIGGNPFKYLKAFDPSKNNYVYLRVHPKCQTALEAQAWTYKIDKYEPMFRT